MHCSKVLHLYTKSFDGFSGHAWHSIIAYQVKNNIYFVFLYFLVLHVLALLE